MTSHSLELIIMWICQQIPALAQSVSLLPPETFRNYSFYGYKLKYFNSLLQVLNLTKFALLSQLWTRGEQPQQGKTEIRIFWGTSWADIMQPMFLRTCVNVCQGVLTGSEEQPAAETCLPWFQRFRCDASHWNGNKDLLSFKDTWKAL